MSYLGRLFRPFRNPYVLVILGVLFAVLGAKFILIQKLGSDVPFWDQWDSEADRLYIPSAEGHLEAAEFFRPHNEHRIVFTKALALLLLKLNGQWDARLQMTVNAMIHVAAIIILLSILQKHLSKAWFLVTGVLCILSFALPFAWENTLAGFQSPFYFLFLFSLLHFAGTLAAAPRTWQWWSGQFAGFCAEFAMGSGFFSAVIIITILVFRLAWCRKITRLEIGLIAWNTALIAIGLALVSVSPGHETLRAHNIGDFVGSFASLASWPSRWTGFFLITLVPVAVVAYQRCRSKAPLGHLDFVLALAGWWLLQIVAISFARGGDNHALSPRYFDSLAIGILAILVLWKELINSTRLPATVHGTMILLFSLWLIFIGMGLRRQTISAWDEFLSPLASVNQARIDTVAEFVLTGDPQFYAARPWSDLPYPDPKRLGHLLSNRNILAILPNSIRAPLPVTVHKASTNGFVRNGPVPDAPFPRGRTGWSSFSRPLQSSALLRSDIIEPTASRFIRLWVLSDSLPATGSLFLETDSDRWEISVPANAVHSWKSVVIDTPPSPYRIVAESQPGTALAFTDPVELAFGSWLVRHVLKSGLILCIIGCVFMVLGLFCTSDLVAVSRNIALSTSQAVVNYQERSRRSGI